MFLTALISSVATITCLFQTGVHGRHHYRWCTAYNYMVCWQPMDEYYGEMARVIAPTLNQQELEQHCRTYDDAEECFDRIYHSCPQRNRSFLDGVDDAYSWLCDDAREEYTAHRDCFADVRLHTEGEFCNSTLWTRVHALNQTRSISYQYERICQYVNDYLDCVQNAVTSFCGEDAGSWQRELDTRLREPLMRHAHCRLHEDGVVYYPGYPTQQHKQDSDENIDWSQTKIWMIGTIAILGTTTMFLIIAVAARKSKIAKIESNNNSGQQPVQRPQVRFVSTPHGGAVSIDAGALPQKGEMGASGAPPRAAPRAASLAPVLAPPYEAALAPVEGASDAHVSARPFSPPPAYAQLCTVIEEQ